MEFAYDGGGLAKGGDVTLYYDGNAVGTDGVENTQPMVFSGDETTDIGQETGTTVSPDYTAQDSRFNGKINWVQIDLGADDHDHFIDPEDRLPRHGQAVAERTSPNARRRLRGGPPTSRPRVMSRKTRRPIMTSAAATGEHVAGAPHPHTGGPAESAARTCRWSFRRGDPARARGAVEHRGMPRSQGCPRRPACTR